MRIRLAAVAVFTLFLSACDSADSGSSASAAADRNTAAPAAAQTAAKPEPDRKMVGAVESRKAVFVVIKDNFVPLALMAGGRAEYNIETAQKLANRLPTLFEMIDERFVTDTRGSGVETEALDAIWEDMESFKLKSSRAVTAARSLSTVAGDEAQFKDAVMELRSACGSCHDDFRVDND